MAKKIHHMSVNLEGVLRNYKKKKINFMENDGRVLSDTEARLHIHTLQAQGHKLMCCSDKCEGFDPFGGGCPGHPINED